ncbi:hypothetical protein EOM71_00520 [Candidatus Falkowbacteria bacterium]|nr:hypothetical protein [Candidatus Falkowbacteria bacterium]
MIDLTDSVVKTKDYSDLKICGGSWIRTDRLFDRQEDYLVDLDRLQLVNRKIAKIFYFWKLWGYSTAGNYFLNFLFQNQDFIPENWKDRGRILFVGSAHSVYNHIATPRCSFVAGCLAWNDFQEKWEAYPLEVYNDWQGPIAVFKKKSLLERIRGILS